ncbi:DUF305 domain-containing protein [Paractinoplanes rishiriensis]|uniref:DUF305 domain-containing protein n=1 Tax=Paractinoplanes rishiriensis TaxID=1050105 RepID=A0A919N1L0_9ACTN|nr:DUF305 domain-containing protein [Actinoplanes rishiriensis]GIF01736.1 hypothetical protein Ari01nite_92000 [Actinoplanes rishiriensis]
MMRSFALPSAARRAGLAAGVAAITTILLSACGGDHPTTGSGTNHDGMMPPASAVAGATFNNADVAFAEHMIPHHQQAVTMAAMAARHASDTQVKELAAKVRQSQQPEIDTMNNWLTTWGQPAPMSGTDHSSMPGMMSDTDMATLNKATGAAFDRHFLTMMISHHEGAITMATEETERGFNPDAKALAQKIITDQQAEITTMKAILDRL